MSIPADYEQRVYAGVLGKLIGVYLGRPFEGWAYERIMAELGEVYYYVHEKLDHALIVTDDDITGTFTFLRALADHGYTRNLQSAQVGRTWLNYLIERRTILWWGGMGMSTEHTAYVRLKNGIEAPASGSIALNGRAVAEQIGAQIFIDGWAMVAPDNPELAVYLAGQAARVSHDGEAVYAAQLLTAMESMAFVEHDLNRLLDAGLRFIPRDSTIARLVADVREWHSQEPDWHKTRGRIAQHYGYDQYPGNCHVVPNHALILLGLLYGDDDFQQSLMITNTAGWDTDCNSGNVGCLLGIKNGLAGLHAGPDWRGPVADRMYLPTADGGRAVTDAVTEAFHVINLGRRLAGKDTLQPKQGARFHFELPGAVQGFVSEASATTNGTVTLENMIGHSRLGQRSLALHYKQLAPGRVARIATATFTPPDAIQSQWYTLVSSPALYAGQVVRAGLMADAENASTVACQLYVRWYGADDALMRSYGPVQYLSAGAVADFTWQVDSPAGAPIAEIGLEIRTVAGGSSGTVYLDYLTWDGVPQVILTRPNYAGEMWWRAWVDAVDDWTHWASSPFHIAHDDGIGLLLYGTQQWVDYEVEAVIETHLSRSCGLVARAQGLRRYYALVLHENKRLLLVRQFDDVRETLAEFDFGWEFEYMYRLKLRMNGAHLTAWVDEKVVFNVHDTVLAHGAIGLCVEAGCLSADSVQVSPVVM